MNSNSNTASNGNNDNNSNNSNCNNNIITKKRTIFETLSMVGGRLG